MTAAAKFAGDCRHIHRAIGAQTYMVAVHVAEFTGPVLYFMDQCGDFNVFNPSRIIDHTV